MKSVSKMDEKEMRESEVPKQESMEELTGYIRSLVEREHDYGTCVYAMSMAAVAAFNYVAHKLGVTGFQASCADLDILARIRGMKGGFRIINYENLLYPQYCDDEHTPGWQIYLVENAEWLATEAAKKLAERGTAHPNVAAHWQRLAKSHSPNSGEGR